MALGFLVSNDRVLHFAHSCKLAIQSYLPTLEAGVLYTFQHFIHVSEQVDREQEP